MTDAAVGVTNGSPTVTGVATAVIAISTAGTRVEINGVAYTVLTAVGTTITLTGNYAAASGSASLIALPYGAASVSNFNLPDLRGRVPVGLDNMNGSDAGRLSDVNVPGGSGGVESALLALAQVPDHAHQPGNGGMNGATIVSATDVAARAPSGGADPNFRTSSSIFASGAYGSAARGAQTVLSRMQPYTLSNWIIYAGV